VMLALAGCSDDRARGVPEAQHQHPHMKDAGSGASDAGDARVPDSGADADAAVSPIINFVAAQAYHDFPSLALIGLQRAHKFETLIDAAIEPADIATLRVVGPNGFVFEFANEPFSDSLNGYVRNEGVMALWFQAIDIGELEDGRYTLELTLTTGKHAE